MGSKRGLTLIGQRNVIEIHGHMMSFAVEI